MELQTQPRFCPPHPRPYTAPLVWVCLACGRLASYEAAPHYSMDNVDGLDNSLQGTSSAANAMSNGFGVITALSDREAAAHAYSSPLPNTTQHHFGHPQCGSITGSTAAASASSGSSPATSTPPRPEQRHSCVNSSPDSYLSQAASSSQRQREQQQQQRRRPSSVSRRVTGVTAEIIHPDSVASASEGELVSAEPSDPCAGAQAFGDDEILVCDGISPSHCWRAPTTVTTPRRSQLPTSLGSTSNESSTLAVTPCETAVAALPPLSAISSPLWRDAGVHDIGKLSSTGARSRQQEDHASCSLTALLMEEHLVGSREMRFCRCCGEVRCAEIRKVTELLSSPLPAGAADKVPYTDKEGYETMAVAAQATVESEHEHWKVKSSRSCSSAAICLDGGAKTVYGPFTSQALYSSNESQPLGVSSPAAESGCKPPETAQAKAREEIPSVYAVALSVTRLLSKVKTMMVAALGNFHPLSPALPKAYFSRHGHDVGDKAAIRGYGNGVLASDAAPRSASSIARHPPRGQEVCRPTYPLYNPSEGTGTNSDHWKSLSASTATSKTPPLASVSAEEYTLTCLASLLGGGAVEDLNGISLDSSAQPSWVFTAPDEEEMYRAEDDDEGLMIHHQRGGVQSDEDACAGGAEDAHTCVRRLYDDSTSMSSIMGSTAAAAATRRMRACKDKWNSISVAEALWRLVLPSFSAPFLSTASMPSAPRRGAVESTASSTLVTSTRPYRGFRGDVEEAVCQLDVAQLEVAKLRLQQVLAAVMAEQLRREGQSRGEYPT
ncbi:hypothetical protein, unknown function [Leishmania mexicana MHOM/GT/2001/U1103]|uniref:Uncharacterized protein n=1 Tax=Leishmania mexicana (strain MHOM/GT/2001/U1103) TaxID=929439 RepID=E9AS65_LEIMU|nr:hypothetical protein, unknown function [Leishmania mexicana MHOM/GT/2001/U1103]CBZ25786.1 hypothetical protein, unknown function [Leishmania mexicana MHOM/GT/2001/U1103]